jgi:hypothetical protein
VVNIFMGELFSLDRIVKSVRRGVCYAIMIRLITRRLFNTELV